MHICLLIDALTALALLHGLLHSTTRSRQLLCLASLIYLACISIHYYLVFADYFGTFQRHPALATLVRAELLKFFGGFWTFFGLMVLARGVTWIALTFTLYNLGKWLTRPKPNPIEPYRSNQSMQPRNPEGQILHRGDRS